MAARVMVEASTNTSPTKVPVVTPADGMRVEASTSAAAADVGVSSAPSPLDGKPSEHLFDVPILDLRDQRPPTAPPRGTKKDLPPGGNEGIYTSEDLAGMDVLDLRGKTPRSADGVRQPPPAPEAEGSGTPPLAAETPRSPGGSDGGGLDDMNICNHCAKSGASQRCGRCWGARYCSVDCQREAWLMHKTECRRRPKPSTDTAQKAHPGPALGAPVAKATVSLCARCNTFDKTKEPAALTPYFALNGTEVLPDNYGGDGGDGRGRHTVKERGVKRTRWKCVCKGCNKTWWCIKSEDPDKVFDTTIEWTQQLEAFKEYDLNLRDIDPRDPRQEGGPRIKLPGKPPKASQ